MQSDPLGLYDGPNTYGYAQQNPLIYTDPTGEAAKAVLGGIGVAIGLCVKFKKACVEAIKKGLGKGKKKAPKDQGPEKPKPEKPKKNRQCVLIRSSSPGSPLNSNCKKCTKCQYRCTGPGIVGGGQFITRFMLGSCPNPVSGLVPGFIVSAHCEAAAERGETQNPEQEGH